MPGIFGFFNKKSGSKEANELLIEAMESRLAHNSDYVCESFAYEWCGLGNIGLAWRDEQRFLVDQSAGKAATFSGYIYDWKNVDSRLAVQTTRKASRLLDIHEKYGYGLPEKIDGSFNALVIDLKKREAVLCNDRMGHRQMYYFEDGDIFMFSAEYKAFFAYDGFKAILDMAGAADYFNFDYLLGEKTFLRDVKFLPGGRIISFKGNKVEFRKYWDFDFGKPLDYDLPGLIEKADSIYRRIIRKRVGDVDNIILPLSGGLDSRFILAHALEAGAGPRAFTHGRRNCLDHRIARKVASALGVEHYNFIQIDPSWVVEHMEKFVFLSEGMTEASPAILLGISSQYGLPASSTIFLNGIYGGPTNFGGGYYRDYDLVEDMGFDDKLRNIARSLFGGSLTEEYYALFSPDFRVTLKSNHMTSLEEEFPKYLHIDGFHNQKDIFFIRNRLVRYMDQVDINRYIRHDHFALHDDDLIDFYMELPPKYKLARRFFIEYFKAKFPGLAAIQYQGTGVNLYRAPSAFKAKLKANLNKVKYYAERLTGGRLRFYNRDNYHHFNQWYRADKRISAFYENLLLDSMTENRGFFNKPAVEALLRRQKAGGNSFYEISSLASFEMFNRLFMDG